MLTLTADKQVYQVGETPTFSVAGGVPGVGILWSAYKDDALIELQRAEGIFNGFGNYASVGPILTSNDVGHWVKQIFVNNGEGSSLVAQAVFDVEPAPVVPDPDAVTPETETDSNFFDGSVDIFGQHIPTWTLLVGGVLAFFLLGKKGR
jgi:hypothetical protein